MVTSGETPPPADGDVGDHDRHGCGYGQLVATAAARSFARDPQTVAAARAWVCQQAACRGWQAASDVIELLVSEIVTNAVRHTRAGRLVLRVALVDDAAAFEVAVYDTDLTLPHPRRAGAWDEGGRGLAVVETLADDWDVMPLPDGKWVRFRIRRPRRLARSGEA